MKNRLMAIFRSDDFIPTMAVFPSIDATKIAVELDLAETGKSRGLENQPPSSSKQFDHIETSVIERIEELRRKGLENYETNRRVYNERLARAGQASKEVEITAGSARNDFGKVVQEWKSRIESPRERLNETFVWRKRFREIHRLERPAKVFEGWIKVFAIALILIGLEAVFNSYLFSKGNEFGLLGGLLAAVIVSLVNVGMSAFLGYLARYIHHRNWILKLGGICAVTLWIGFAASMNLAVAHFRDGLEQGLEWSRAAMGAVPHLLSSPFDLVSIESWFLIGIGALISMLSFRKGWHTDDPYPGYGRVDRALEEARAEYEGALELALTELKVRRDQAIEDLQAANEEVRRGIGEAIDALFGQSALGSHLKTFLEQCDVKCAHLLAIYRDANIAVRTEPKPGSFDRAHIFGAFKPEPVDSSRKKAAEAEAAKVAATVETATRAIFDLFDAARREFAVTAEAQRPSNDASRQTSEQVKEVAA